MSVELPKKHGRGGQSAMRFARLRLEKRAAYVLKCCEMAVQNFITDNVVNVKGIVVGGSAQLKFEMTNDERFDKRLSACILTTVDVSYGQD